MRRRTAVVMVLSTLLGASALAGPLTSAGASVRPTTAPLADGTRFHENGNATEYISWFGASLPMSAADARAYSAEGNSAVTTVAAGYVTAHPASGFPAHRAVRIVGSLSQFVDDGQEMLPLRVEDTGNCLTNLGQAHIAVVPEQWSRPFPIGPDTTCAKPAALGPFSLVQTYSPPTQPSFIGVIPEATFIGPGLLGSLGGGLVGDFNGDGRADQFVYGSGSAPDELWYGTNNGFKLGPPVTVNGIYDPVVGDFNGDGRADILWYSLGAAPVPGGVYPSSLWLGRPGNAGFLNGHTIPTPPPNVSRFVPPDDFVLTEYLPFVGDFNGDGKSDVYWTVLVTTEPRLPANVVWYGKVDGFTVGPKSTAPFTFNPEATLTSPSPSPSASGARFARPLAAARLAHRLATALKVSINPHFVEPPVIGDYNGDGRADLLWYAPGHTKLWRGAAGTAGFTNPPTPVATVFGSYEPIEGDFNGDGHADVLWYGFGTARDALWMGSSGGFTNGPSIAINGFYEPVVADYNGDGKSDVFWYDPTGGDHHTWFGRASGFTHAPDSVTAPDSPEDLVLPMPGDFNGDGHDDLLLFRDHQIQSNEFFTDVITDTLWHAH